MSFKYKDMSYASQNLHGPKTAHDLLFNTHGYQDRTNNPIVVAKMQAGRPSKSPNLAIPGISKFGGRRISISGAEIGSYGSSFYGPNVVSSQLKQRKLRKNASLFKKNQAPPKLKCVKTDNMNTKTVKTRTNSVCHQEVNNSF